MRALAGCSQGDQRDVEGLLSAIQGNITETRISPRQSKHARVLFGESQISSGLRRRKCMRALSGLTAVLSYNGFDLSESKLQKKISTQEATVYKAFKTIILLKANSSCPRRVTNLIV